MAEHVRDWVERALAEWPVVRTFARQFTADDATADDLAQDAYLRLISNVASLDASRAPRPLLLTTVRRLWIDRTRRAGSTVHEPSAELEDTGASPLARAVAREDSTVLRAELARLPRAWGAALFLADGLDAPAEEIADILGTTPEVVRVTLHRARKRLRARLTPVHSERPDEHD